MDKLQAMNFCMHIVHLERVHISIFISVNLMKKFSIAWLLLVRVCVKFSFNVAD